MARPKHILKNLDNSSVRLVNDNFRKALDELELSNFKNGEIKTENVTITQNIIQAPVITTEGSEIDGAHITPDSITTDKIVASAITADKIAAGAITAEMLQVDNLNAFSSNLGEIDAGQIVVGDNNNKLWLNDNGDGSLAIGGSVKANAPCRVDSQGNALMESATVSGKIYSSEGTLSGITQANVDVGPYGNVRGGMTDFMTGVGFFEGWSGGAYKQSIGNPAGDYASWDGQNFRIAGNIILTSALALFSCNASNLPVVPQAVGFNNPSGVD